MRHTLWLAGLFLAVLCVVPAQAATTITYVYDDLNRLQTVTRGDGPTYTYTYDEAGNITRWDTTTNWVQQPTTLTVTTSATIIVPGQSVTLTATVSGNAPTGTVQFKVNGVNFGPPVPLVNGVATLTTDQLPPGNNVITAVFSGNPNNAPSNATAPITVTVNSSHDGDLNNDGKVDLADVLLGYKILNGEITPTADQLSHGDVAPLVNGTPTPNGVFDLGDLLVIERKALGDIVF